MNTFVRMTVKEGDAKFRNQHGRYEEFVCRWEDFAVFLTEMLETDAAIESPTTVRFELIETEQEFSEWCSENEVVTDDM